MYVSPNETLRAKRVALAGVVNCTPDVLNLFKDY